MSPSEVLEREGWLLRPGAVAAPRLAGIEALIDSALGGHGALRRDTAVFAARALLRAAPELAPALASAGLDALASGALGAPAFPIDAKLLDKVPGANWKVPAHQDVVVPVRERIETPGFTAWTLKAGMPHVIPPREVLEGLVALRLHLDDVPEGGGELQVAPGTHRGGRLSDDELAALPSGAFVSCPARRGDVLLMRPLLVHRSSPARPPRRRRVLHLVYAAAALPGPLRWRCARAS